MLNKININDLREMFPYLIYQRILLPANARGQFFFPVENGYYYWLRHIRCKWPEVGAAAFNQGMNIEIRGSARHREYQDAPVSLRLLSTPCGNGVALVGAAGMTATGPGSVKLIDEILFQRDNIEIYISGHNAVPFPAFIDILLIGYMIPDKRNVQFRGTN